MLIRAIQPTDAEAWRQMRRELWPSVTDEHAIEIAEYFDGRRGEPQAVLLAIDDSGEPVGFAELSIRPYAEGCASGRVAYLEGWYVRPEHRRRGVGRALVRAAEDWGRAQGCTEFGSDTEIENEVSTAAHRALGFTEVLRAICFRKAL